MLKPVSENNNFARFKNFLKLFQNFRSVPWQFGSVYGLHSSIYGNDESNSIFWSTMFHLREKSHLGKKISKEQEAFSKNVKNSKMCSMSGWELIRAFTQLFRKRWFKECLLKHHIQSTWQNPKHSKCAPWKFGSLYGLHSGIYGNDESNSIFWSTKFHLSEKSHFGKKRFQRNKKRFRKM